MKLDSIVRETNFRDVESYLHCIVKKFIRRYPKTIELSEAISIAHLAYTKAEKEYDEEKSEFKTWVGYKVWNSLMEEIRLRTNRHRILKRRIIVLSEVP